MLSPIEVMPQNGGVPIRLFVTPDLLPDAATLAQLENLANVPGLAHHVAGLPDIHRKSRNPTPTGTVVVTKNALVPRAVDAGINCGMRILRSDIDVRDVSAAELDALYGTVMHLVPGHQHDQHILSKAEVAEILVHGGAWCQKTFGLSDAELHCIEDRATAPTDTQDAEAILASVPRKAINKGRRRFCTIGGGNHFLELQEIIDVLDPETADKLELRAGKAVFMLHTCSRGVASNVMRAYVEELAEKFPPPSATPASPLWSVPADTEEGVQFARAIAAAANFGFANRIVVTEKLRAAVHQVLHDTSLSLLYDCAHVSIKPEVWGGERLWVHRHGASRALPPSQMAEHAVFGTTGQPVPIPGSMGHDSFIGVADETAAAAFWSVNHGAGRVLDKPEAVARFTAAQVEQQMRDKHIRLYRYGTDNIAEQAPSSFKDVSQVVQAMTALSLAKPVVRVRPVAVLKG
jgi:tRNA-splicing ligase RtcB